MVENTVAHETLEQYLDRMRPTAAWAARIYAVRGDLCLEPEDLLQDAMETLCRVWHRLHGEKSEADLKYIGRTAVLRQCGRLRDASGTREHIFLSLDEPAFHNAQEHVLAMSHPYLECEVLSADGDEDIFFPFAVEIVTNTLGLIARRVFAEIRQPSKPTVDAAFRWRQAQVGRPGNWWAKARTQVLAEGIGLPATAVKAALKEIRAVVHAVFLEREPSDCVYRNVREHERHFNPLTERSRTMPTKGFNPDELDLEAAAPATPKADGKQDAAKATEAAKPTAKKAKAAAKPKKAAKAAKKAAEPKAAKPAAKKAAEPKAAKPAAKKAKAAAKNGHDVMVKAGEETGGPFRQKIRAFAEKPISIAALIEKAEAAKIPTPGWKINDMLKRGQLQSA